MDLLVYVFIAEDAAQTDPTTEIDDLVRVGMQSGSGLNWALLQVTIKIDGGAPMTAKMQQLMKMLLHLHKVR